MNKKNLVASRRNLNPQPSIGRVFQVLLRGHQRLNGTDHQTQSPVAHPRLKWQFTGQTDFECGCGHHVFKLKSRTLVSHRKPFVLAPQSGETIQPHKEFVLPEETRLFGSNMLQGRKHYFPSPETNVLRLICFCPWENGGN